MTDTWTEVADRVYVRRHQSMDLNVSLIVGEGACLVVDTRATEKEGQDLVEAIRTVTPHPWVVVNTHFHFDHTFGNRLFRPAEIWGHRRCAQQLIEDGERMRGAIAGRYREHGLDEMAAEIEASAIDPPDQLVDDLATLTRRRPPGAAAPPRPRAHRQRPGAHRAGRRRPGDRRRPGRGGRAAAVRQRVPAGLAADPGRGRRAGHRPAGAGARRGGRPRVRRRPSGPSTPSWSRGPRDGHANGRPAADVAKELPYFGDCALEGVERAYLQLQ